MNIFVTVGTGKFDQLVKAIDQFIEQGKIKDNLTIQIGSGDYIPKFCNYFRFAPSLDQYYQKADLIIAHGGAGITYETLAKNKKLLSIANLDRTDVHQEEILKALSQNNYILWCKNLNTLPALIKKAKTLKFKKYTPPKCTIAKEIIKFLEQDVRDSRNKTKGKRRPKRA